MFCRVLLLRWLIWIFFSPYNSVPPVEVMRLGPYSVLYCLFIASSSYAVYVHRACRKGLILFALMFPSDSLWLYRSIVRSPFYVMDVPCIPFQQNRLCAFLDFQYVLRFCYSMVGILPRRFFVGVVLLDDYVVSPPLVLCICASCSSSGPRHFPWLLRFVGEEGRIAQSSPPSLYFWRFSGSSVSIMSFVVTMSSHSIFSFS